MTNTALLQDRISQSGLKLNYIAKMLGLSTYGLSRKIRNLNAFKVDEMRKLCVILSITDPVVRDAIFFADEVENNSTFTIPEGGEHCV